MLPYSLALQIDREMQDLSNRTGVENVMCGVSPDGRFWIEAVLNGERKTAAIPNADCRVEIYKQWFPDAPETVWASDYWPKPSLPLEA